MTTRRELLALFAGGAATPALVWPRAAGAQQPAKLPTIGFLGAATASTWHPWTAAFVARLRELGWVDGRTVAIEVRWADGREERYAEIAAEFVRRKVDVIVTAGGAVAAAKRATSAIPIVFAVANSPVESGLVASLARPGGNVTGLSGQHADSVGKRLELLREVGSRVRTVAVLATVAYPAAALELSDVVDAARRLGLDSVKLEIRRAEDIAPAFDALAKRADTLYVCADPLMVAEQARVTTLAQDARLPSISGLGSYAEAGGLMSCGASFPDLFRRAADYVDKILRGTKPARIPVEQPTKFELVVNAKTAKKIGIEIPPTLLARADEVIE